MIQVFRPRADFVASGGLVAPDRLFLQVQEDSTFAAVLLMAPLPEADNVEFLFDVALTAPEDAALDAIVAAHSGVGVPVGDGFCTQQAILSLATAAPVVASFVNDTHVPTSGIRLIDQRQAMGPGLLQKVSVRSSLAAGSVTVRLVVGGTPVGSGVTAALSPNASEEFSLLLAESEYVKDALLGIEIAGLTNGSDSLVEAMWSEAG